VEPAPPTAKKAAPTAAEQQPAKTPAETPQKTPAEHQQRLKEIKNSLEANEKRIKDIDAEIEKARAKRDERFEKYAESPTGEGSDAPRSRKLQEAREAARQRLASSERRVQALEAKKGAVQSENSKLYEEWKAIDRDLHPEKYPKTTIEKGNIGEQAAHDHMEANEGFKKIGSSKEPTNGSGGTPAGTKSQGIDGVYENTAPPPKYVVGEAKYVTDPKRKPTYGESVAGKQDTPEWVDANLDQAVGRAKADLIRAEGYQYWELRYDPKTNSVTRTIKWSTASNKPKAK
jgi:hypothetical protein